MLCYNKATTTKDGAAMDIKKTGDLIASRRKLLKMTQKELAEKLNVTDKAVSKWERGQGYPEITTIPHLAEVLGVSPSEIMLGEAAAAQAKPEEENAVKTEEIVSGTVDYMEHLNGQKMTRSKDIAFLSVTLTLLAAIFVSGLCNYIISKTFDWSLYVVGGCIFTFAIIAPLLKCKKHAIYFSAGAFSVFIIPLLALIEYLCPAKDWLWGLALPIVLIALASIWGFLLLITLAKLKPLYLTASALIIFGVLDNLVFQGIVGDFLKLAPSEKFSLSSVIVSICSGFAAAAIFIYAVCSRKKKSK